MKPELITHKFNDFVVTENGVDIGLCWIQRVIAAGLQLTDKSLVKPVQCEKYLMTILAWAARTKSVTKVPSRIRNMACKIIEEYDRLSLFLIIAEVLSQHKGMVPLEDRTIYLNDGYYVVTDEVIIRGHVGHSMDMFNDERMLVSSRVFRLDEMENITSETLRAPLQLMLVKGNIC